jgi:succinyl-diaminopimelate desuccinylase
MENARPIDPVELTRELIRCASVTPADDGALGILEGVLGGLGFVCHRLPFSAPETATVDNLYARFGDGRPNFCFAGHSDVVPVGDAAAWGAEPFAGFVSDGTLHGRGAVDMKGAIACFAAAAERFLARRGAAFEGAISLLITGDEEGPAVNGTVRVLDWMRQAGEVIDHCLVGEPTNPERLGQMIKNGRRGSLNGHLVVEGAQGHVAYPQLADNPVPRLLAMLRRLQGRRFDDGDANFQASNLEITSLEAGMEATNVTPAEATARFNIRFNTRHTGASLRHWIGSQCAAVGGDYSLDIEVSGEAFLTAPGDFTRLLVEVVEETTGIRPALSTSGGTSDARFIKEYCPVAEFGLTSQTMHKLDEQVRIADLETLTRVYERLLERYFERYSERGE